MIGLSLHNALPAQNAFAALPPHMAVWPLAYRRDIGNLS